MTAVAQALQRNLALDQLRLQDFSYGLELVFVLAGEDQLLVLLVQFDVATWNP